MYRITDPSAVEARLLELAHTTDVKITAPVLAYFAPCSIEDAARVLDDLVVRNHMTMDVDDEGTVVYGMPGRQRIAAGIAPPRVPTVLVPRARHDREASPTLAAALALWIPGAGHLYAGRAIAAILWFMVVSLGYVLILPGLVLHLVSIGSAVMAARRMNGGSSHTLPLAAARIWETSECGAS